jgi:ABC-2 type transport system permease protein
MNHEAVLIGPPTTASSAGSTFQKYYRIFRVSLIERFAYRGDFFLSTILRFLPMVSTILLWTAVFQGAEMAGRTDIAGFERRPMIAYLLLVHISRMFSSMPGLAAGIARDIRDGSLKKYLIQPLDLIGYLIAYRAAHKTAYIAMSSLPYAMLFAACYSYFDGFPDALTMAGYLASLIMAFFVGFFLEVCIGMIGFWLLEVSSILYIVMTLNYFISGHMFPIDLLGEPWASILKMLPTQYTAYFPAMVFLGKIQGQTLAMGLAAQAGWVVALFLLAKVLYRIGLKRYSAYGG